MKISRESRRPLIGALAVSLGLSAASVVLAPQGQAATTTVVTLSFTDAHRSQYDYARPVLDAHGVQGTFYAASGWVDAGSNNSMTWYQLRDLVRDGHEVGGMGRDHKSLTDATTTTEYKTAQVCDDRDRLAAMGLDPQTFAYPQAAVDAAARTIVQGCGYAGARTIGGLSPTSAPYAETVPPADPYRLRTANLPTGPVTLQSLQNAVTKAATNGGGWLPISFTQICKQGTATYTSCMGSSKPVEDTVLSQFLDWLQSSNAPPGTSVGTVRDVLGVAPAPPVPPDPTTVSLTFNDGSVGQYKYALPLLEATGLRATFFIASNWVDKTFAGTMRWWQLDEVYQAGNEIGGMGRDHKDLTATYDSDPAADAAYKTSQVCDDRQRFVEQGYDPRVFAYPTGAYSTAAQDTVRGCGYDAARAAGGLATTGTAYAETLPPKNPYAVRTYSGPSSAITLQQLQDAVTAAATHGGGWVPLVLNQVCRQGTSDYNSCMSSHRPVDDAVLGEFLTWLSNAGEDGGAPAGVTVETMRDALGLPSQPPLAQRPVTVSLTFDDGTASHYRTLAPLSAHGMAATYYLNTGEMKMSWQQVADLAASGADIGGHTLDHVDLTSTTTTYAYKVRQACEDRRNLVERGYSAISFAYPFASYSDEAIEILEQCGYQNARRAGGINPAVLNYAETIPASNPFVIRTPYRESETALELADLTGPVEAAADKGGGWVPFVFHEVCVAGAPEYNSCMASYKAIDLETFTAFLDWLRDSSPVGTSVRTVADVMTAGKMSPRVSITAPAHGSSVTTAQARISGTAAADGGDLTVEVYSGAYATGTPLATLSAVNDGGSWAVTTSSLAEGTYTVRAVQTRNGVKGLSVPSTFTVASDGTSPHPTVTSPAEGDRLATGRVTVSGTAGTAPGDASDVVVELYDGTDAAGAPAQSLVGAVGSAGAWSVTTEQLAEGPYTVVVTQTDQAGNEGTSPAVHFAVDTTAPAVAITSPAGGSTVAGPPLTVRGTAGSAPGDLQSVSLAVYAGSSATGTPVTTTGTSAASGAWSTDLTALPLGTYTLVASQADSAGNDGASQPVTVTVVEEMTVDNVTPSVVSSGSGKTSLTVTGRGFAADAQASLSGSGVVVESQTRVDGSTIVLDVDVLEGAAAGPRDVSVSASGTTTTCSGCLTVRAAPQVTSVSPASLGQGATDVTVKLAGSGLDSTTTATITGTGVTSTVIARKPTLLTLSVSIDSDAATGVRDIVVTDGSGGRSRCTSCFAVLTGVQLTGVSPAGLRRGTTTTVTLTGTGFDRQTSVKVSGAGVTTGSVKWQSPTSMTVVVKVNAGATVGPRSVTVTDHNLGSSTLKDSLTIT